MACDRHLHWTQRIALIQHNLHAASRTGNFTFFSNIQSAHFLHGVDYVATLNSTLGDEADKFISVLDNLNSGIAWSHEEAFRVVYEGLKNAATSPSATENCGYDHQQAIQKRLQSDIVQQRASADGTIDKMMTTAVSMIEKQPPHVHEDAANAFMLGTTFIADAVQVSLEQLTVLEECATDANVARADAAYSLVMFAVSAAVSALKGVLNMMELHEDAAGPVVAQHARRAPVASVSSFAGFNASRARAVSNTSDDSATGQISAPSSANQTNNGGSWNVFRRMSAALGAGNSPAPNSRKNSLVSNQSSSASSTNGSSPTPHAAIPHVPATRVPATSSTGTTAPPPSFTIALKSPPGTHKRGVSMPTSQMHGHILSPIMGTPGPSGEEGLKNPFESSFALSPPPVKNEKAWISNQETTRMADSRSNNPSPASSPGPAQHTFMPMGPALAQGTAFATPQASETTFAAPRPVDATEHATFVDASSPPPVQRSVSDDNSRMTKRLHSDESVSKIRHGRRRSTEVRQAPPDIERLRMMGLEAGVSL